MSAFDLRIAMFSFVMAIINGVFGMITGSILFGGIGLFFGLIGWYVATR